MKVDVKYKNLGLYHIDLGYLKHLHDDIDTEVYYSEDKAYSRKPFLGILVVINAYTYFIPFTSSKPKHVRWPLSDRAHFLLYEVIKADRQKPGDIVKPLSSGGEGLKILAVLDIKKMIPVPDGLYNRIDFNAVQNEKYRGLLQKEYRFCLKIQDKIIKAAGRVYQDQKEGGKVYPMYCNFTALEKACDEYLSE